MIESLLLMGSTEKDAGKTTLSSALIRWCRENLSLPVYAVKATLRHGESEKYLKITEETDPERKKDTGKLLRAGAEKVFWLRCDESSAIEGIEKIFKELPAPGMVVCESNTLRLLLEPALFLMVRKLDEASIKKSAERVLDLADLTIRSSLTADGWSYDPDILTLIGVEGNRWVIKNMK